MQDSYSRIRIQDLSFVVEGLGSCGLHPTFRRRRRALQRRPSFQRQPRAPGGAAPRAGARVPRRTVQVAWTGGACCGCRPSRCPPPRRCRRHRRRRRRREGERQPWREDAWEQMEEGGLFQRQQTTFPHRPRGAALREPRGVAPGRPQTCGGGSGFRAQRCQRLRSSSGFKPQLRFAGEGLKVQGARCRI